MVGDGMVGLFISLQCPFPNLTVIRPRMTGSNITKSSNVAGGNQQFRSTTSCPVFEGGAGSGLWSTYHLSLLPTLRALTRPNISLRALKLRPTRLPSSHLNPIVPVPCPPYPAPLLSATRRSSSTSGGEMTETGHGVTALCALSTEMDESSSYGGTGSARMGSLQPDGRLCGLANRPSYSMGVPPLKSMSLSPTLLSRWTSLKRRQSSYDPYLRPM
jgi:hypothetical protein